MPFYCIITSRTSKALKMPRVSENIEMQHYDDISHLHSCILDNLTTSKALKMPEFLKNIEMQHFDDVCHLHSCILDHLTTSKGIEILRALKRSIPVFFHLHYCVIHNVCKQIMIKGV